MTPSHKAEPTSPFSCLLLRLRRSVAEQVLKPFSTGVLCKRTYRELKLLKHIRHENVRPSYAG
jgi:hypothetical protein